MACLSMSITSMFTFAFPLPTSFVITFSHSTPTFSSLIIYCHSHTFFMLCALLRQTVIISETQVSPPPHHTRDTSMMIKLNCINPEHQSSFRTYIFLFFLHCPPNIHQSNKAITKTHKDHLIQANEYHFLTFTIESLSDLEATIIQ